MTDAAPGWDSPFADEEPPDVDAAAGKAEKEPLICPKCGKDDFKNLGGLRGHEFTCRGPKTEKVKPDGYTPPAGGKPNLGKLAGGGGGKRKSTARIMGGVWSALAKLSPSPAASRAMLWEAPAAGRTLDVAVADSWVDKKLLQKAAQQEDKWSPVWSLVSLPLMLAICEQKPMMKEVLSEYIQDAIEENLEAALEVAVPRKRRADKIAEKSAELGLQEELDTDEDGKPVPLARKLMDEMLYGGKEPDTTGG